MEMRIHALIGTPESCMEVVGSGCDPFVAEITYLHLDGIILGIGRIVAP